MFVYSLNLRMNQQKTTTTTNFTTTIFKNKIHEMLNHSKFFSLFWFCLNVDVLKLKINLYSNANVFDCIENRCCCCCVLVQMIIPTSQLCLLLLFYVCMYNSKCHSDNVVACVMSKRMFFVRLCLPGRAYIHLHTYRYIY